MVWFRKVLASTGFVQDHFANLHKRHKEQLMLVPAELQCGRRIWK